jgi:hypothetical protein
LNLAGSGSELVKPATLFVSILVAVSTGAIQVFRLGNEWALNQDYASALDAVGWQYLEKAGRYRGYEYPGEAFHRFFEDVEALRKARAERRGQDIRGMADEAAKEPPPKSDSQKHEGTR